MKVAVVGATGAVGRRLLEIFEQRKFPVSELRAFASSRSAGKELPWKSGTIRCQELSRDGFQGIQIAFFDASDAVSAEWVPAALAAGAWVVDNSATFRLNSNTPLVVPEVNGDRISLAKERLVSGPNCSAAQMVVPLKAIHDRWGLKRVVVSTYQSVSGAGTEAIEELRQQTGAELLGQPPVSPRIFPHSIAFNCLPQIGRFSEDGYTSEESKMMAETRKILELPDLAITVTAVRVPTVSCHAESVNIECIRPFEMKEVIEVLSGQRGVKVIDSPEKAQYPLNTHAAGRDEIQVGRIRRDVSVPNGLNLWVVSDNLRKGAALNAVQIAEEIIRRHQL